jgi:Flp pilus assembly protein TadG
MGDACARAYNPAEGTATIRSMSDGPSLRRAMRLALRLVSARLREPRRSKGPSRRSKGQALTEFALIAPVLLAMVALCIDVGRVYWAWVNLESATRDAAQYLATSSPDSTDANWSGTNADNKAKFIVDSSTGTTFTISANQANCATTGSTALVKADFTPRMEASYGATAAYPVGEAVVRSCMNFRTLVPWPLFTNNGDFVLRSERTYRSVVGR